MKTPRLCEPEREIEAENEGTDYAIARGWWTCKFTTPTMNGVPDRVFFRIDLDGTRCVMVEWKKDGEVPTTQQEKRHKELREHGVEVYWFSRKTYDEFKAIMR